MRFFRILAIIALLFLPPAIAQGGEMLMPARNLRTDGAQARAQRLPIVLFFRTADCPFCRQIEDQYLPALLRENARQPMFILRTVEIDSARPVTDFDATVTDMRGFAGRQKVRLVPHLRFVGPDGEALVPDLVGLTTPDFYAAYLEGSIRAAGDRLRSR